MATEKNDSISVLIVDDDDIYRDYIIMILKAQANWKIFEAVDSQSMGNILEDNTIDCVLLDYNMGTESGLFISEMIKKKYSDPPPIIMLTGEGQERTIVKAFRAGFSDFLSKWSLSVRELLEAINRAVDRKQTERVEKGERNRLARQSSVDSATGLHGVDFIRHRAEELSTSARRRGGQYAAVVISIREFASIGDAFGHIMRDRVLEAFAGRIRRYTREADICGRYTEDTLLYLIDRDAAPRNVWSFCERLSRDLSFEANFDKASFSLAPCMGMALFPMDGNTADSVLAAGEGALARAQKSGVPFAAASPLDASTWPGEVLFAGSESEASGPTVLREVDRRSERRQRVVKRGQVISSSNNAVVDCGIRDISTHGARLSVNEYYSPPEQFTLLIIGTGEKRTVNVRWRRGNEIGVQFVGVVSQSAGPRFAVDTASHESGLVGE